MIVGIEFETVVLHRTRVHELHSVLTSHGKHWRQRNHVLRVLPVVVEREAQASVEQVSIETEVGLGRCFPLQLRVTCRNNLDTADSTRVGSVQVVGTVAQIVSVGGESCIVVRDG